MKSEKGHAMKRPEGSVMNVFEMAANQEARRYAVLYRVTRDGLLVWKAYEEYRKHGVPVPEGILKMFDRFAEQLKKAKSAKAVAAAIQMDKKKGGAAGAARTAQCLYFYDVVEEIERRLWEQDYKGERRNKQQVYEEVAHLFTEPERQRTAQHVKDIYVNKWPKLVAKVTAAPSRDPWTQLINQRKR